MNQHIPLYLCTYMDFGRIKTFDTVDYTLPPDHKSIAKVLGGHKVAEPKLYVGGVLWSDEDFKGTIYPEKAKPSDYVKHYTKQFNTIELNTTHYRVPEPDTFKRWYELAPAGFKFCPKINQNISHAGSLLPMIGFHNECNGLFKLLNEKLGTCFLQLPPHFSPKRLPELLEFLDHSDLRNLAVELRDEDWYSNDADLNVFCNYLYKNNMATVLTDTPGRRDVLHMRLTNKTAFVRFNANNNHPTDKQRIDAWIQKAKSWFDTGLEEFYFFVHTPNQVNMPHLVTYFIQQAQRICGIKLTPPVIKTQTRPETLF